MKPRSTRMAKLLPMVFGLCFLEGGLAQAQIVGQEPARNDSLIGQPPVERGITHAAPPGYPGAGMPGNAPGSGMPAREKLNQTKREAADIDRDGRINPHEASRLLPGTPLPQQLP
jgi:hypothetical protein